VDFGCFACSSIYKSLSCCWGCIKNFNFVNKDHNSNTPCHEWTNLHHHLMCVKILLNQVVNPLAFKVSNLSRFSSSSSQMGCWNLAWPDPFTWENQNFEL